MTNCKDAHKQMMAAIKAFNQKCEDIKPDAPLTCERIDDIREMLAVFRETKVASQPNE